MQARAQTFWGAGAQTPKKRASIAKNVLTKLKHKQHSTKYAVLDLRLLWAGFRPLSYIFLMNKYELLHGNDSPSVLIG